MLESRRDFLKKMGKVAGGLTIIGVAGPLTNMALAEDSVSEEAQQPDFKWEEKEFPCDLIKEITDNSTEKGYRAFKYDPDYRAHITEITFEMNENDKKVRNIVFKDGCDGSTHGVAKMADGKDADFIISRLKGLECNLIKSGSSCPDQLANAVEQAVNIITGTACSHCYFAGNFETAKCPTVHQFRRA